MDQVNMTTPNRQANPSVNSEGLRGRFAPNLANISLFKDNPYIRDLPEIERNELNKNLLKPYNGEAFYDNDYYQWICIYEKDSVTGQVQYKYYSHEKDLYNKISYYESVGVMNQLMSAYNNGRIYNFYVDRANNMIYPNTSLSFPDTYYAYSVIKQQLNANNEKIYLAGTLVDGQVTTNKIAMKTVIDTASNSNYTRMCPAKIFATSDPENGYENIRNGEFYLVEFYNTSGIVIDTKQFQAVDSTVTNTQLPSQNVIGLDVAVIRNGINTTSVNDVYPIFVGENITNTVSYVISAIYNDGTRKIITNLLDGPQLSKTCNEELDTIKASIGKQYQITFTYYPELNADKEPIGSSVSKVITFQVVSNTSEELFKIIPVIWSDTNTNFTIDASTTTKTYKLKVYTMNQEGILANRSRSFFDSMKVVDTDGTLRDYESSPYTYDPYKEQLVFTFPTGTLVSSMIIPFSFNIYNKGSRSEFRFKAQFGSNDMDNSAIFVKPYSNNTTDYGYNTNGPMTYLAETYGTSEIVGGTGRFLANSITISPVISNNKNTFKFVLDSYTKETFSIRYAKNDKETGRKISPNKVELYSIKDSTMTQLTNKFTFANNLNIITIPSIDDMSVSQIIGDLKTNDFIIAKYYNSDGTFDIPMNFDVYIVNKNV